MQATPSALLNVNRIANKSEAGYFLLCATSYNIPTQFSNILRSLCVKRADVSQLCALIKFLLPLYA